MLIAIIIIVWNNLTLADSNKLENIQKNLQIYVIIDLFSRIPFGYEFMLNYLQFKTLYSRRQNLDALFRETMLRPFYPRHLWFGGRVSCRAGDEEKHPAPAGNRNLDSRPWPV
jgi:hypothetical protein